MKVINIIRRKMNQEAIKQIENRAFEFNSTTMSNINNGASYLPNERQHESLNANIS